MTAELLRLFDSNESPNGRRYTAADHEAAYQHWKNVASRSLRKTAEKLDIALSTLGNWSQSDGWAKRAEGEDRKAAESVRLSIASLVMAEVAKSIATIIEIRDDKSAPPRDRLAAAQHLNGLAGIAPISKSQTALTFDPPGQPSEAAPELEGKTIEQLMAIEATTRRNA